MHAYLVISSVTGSKDVTSLLTHLDGSRVPFDFFRYF